MTNLDYDEKTLQEIITQNCVLNEENAELRKQVDELKVLIQDMEQGYYPIMQLRENMEKEKEQTVKDKTKKTRKETAREILQEGKYCLSKSLRDWIKEHYGVEAE